MDEVAEYYQCENCEKLRKSRENWQRQAALFRDLYLAEEKRTQGLLSGPLRVLWNNLKNRNKWGKRMN